MTEMFKMIEEMMANERRHQQEIDFINNTKFSKDYWKRDRRRPEYYNLDLSTKGEEVREKWAAFNKEMEVFDVLVKDMIKFDKDDVKKRNAKYQLSIKQDGAVLGGCRWIGKGKGIHFPDHIWRFIKDYAIPDWNVPQPVGHRQFQINSIYHQRLYDGTNVRYRFMGRTAGGQGKFLRLTGGENVKRVRLITRLYGNQFPTEMKPLNLQAEYIHRGIDRLDADDLTKLITACCLGISNYDVRDSLRRCRQPGVAAGKYRRINTDLWNFKNPNLGEGSEFWSYMDYELARNWWFGQVDLMLQRLCDNFKCLHKKRNVDFIKEMITPELKLYLFEKVFFDGCRMENHYDKEGKFGCRIPKDYARWDNIGDPYEFNAKEDYIKRYSEGGGWKGGWINNNMEKSKAIMREFEKCHKMIGDRLRKWRTARFNCENIHLSQKESAPTNQYFHNQQLLSASC